MYLKKCFNINPKPNVIYKKKDMRKDWMIINGKKDVEYSTDFSFFLKNQLTVIEEVTKVKFISRLESRNFKTISDTFNLGKCRSEKQQIDTCIEIHSDLMSGKFGTVEFID